MERYYTILLNVRSEVVVFCLFLFNYYYFISDTAGLERFTHKQSSSVRSHEIPEHFSVLPGNQMDRDVSEMTWPSSKRHVKSSRCTIRCAGKCVELLLYMYTKSCLEYKPRSSASCHVHHATPSWIIVLWHAPLCVTPYVSFEADRAASFQTRSLTFFFFEKLC